MRVFILLLLGIGLILLATQNGSLQMLVVFGYETFALPLAVWMAIAIAAGLLTSIILQLLNTRILGGRSPIGEPRNLPRRDREPFPEDLPPRDATERVADRPRSQSPPRDRPTSDWETPAPSSDWGEVKKTPPKQPQPSAPPRTDFLKKPPRPSSNPSPSPAGDRNDDLPSKNRVYDAPYRVVNPPVPEPPKPPEEEETWVDEGEDYESDFRKEFRSGE
ncbi:MAG: hypothetical protein SW833_03640 [Cyanobacteriota bacterium]|nr:hypothetical protein [Cyanobacteriota bacterium]